METIHREKVLQTLQQNYNELSKQLEGISNEAAALRPAEDEWSIKETLGHLSVCEEYAHARLVRMGYESNPYLSAFNDHQLIEIRNYRSIPIQEILNVFLAFGRENFELLKNLTEEQWLRTGRHEERGTITINYIAEKMLAEHHQEHLKQIQNLKEWLLSQ